MSMRYLDLIFFFMLICGAFPSLRSQPVLDVTRIDVDVPAVTLHVSLFCGGAGVTNLAATSFSLDENGIRIAELSLVPKADSAGRYLLTYLLSCCTIDRFLLVKIRDVPGCAGEDSVRTYYRRPPPDTTTYWPVQVALGEARVRGGEEAVVPFLLEDSLGETLFPSSFLIRFDTSYARFSSIDTRGKILENIPVTFMETSEGVALYTQIAGVIQGPGTLAALHFITRPQEMDTEIPLRLAGKLYFPCSHTLCRPGKILVFSPTTGIEPSGSAPEHLRVTNYPNPFSERTVIQLRKTNDELRMGNGSEIRKLKSPISLKVYDLLGRALLDLSDRARAGGDIVVDGMYFPSPGLYILRLALDGQVTSTPMIKLR